MSETMDSNGNDEDESVKGKVKGEGEGEEGEQEEVEEVNPELNSDVDNEENGTIEVLDRGSVEGIEIGENGETHGSGGGGSGDDNDNANEVSNDSDGSHINTDGDPTINTDMELQPELEHTTNISIDQDESEEYSSDSSDDDSDEEEPKFKYSRPDLKPPIFTTDDVSSFLITDNLIVFATHSGKLHFFNPDITYIRSIHAHRASILALATDGKYFASGSLDGTVVIGSISDQSDISRADFKRPIHAVALDPNYKNTHAYVSAGTAGNVIYSEKNWLGRRSDTVLHTSEDNPIISLHWIRNLIIWMNEDGITLYSTSKRMILKHIKRPPNSPRADLYKPRICFPETNRIYIAWVDHIWNIKISIGGDKVKSGSFLSSGSSVLSFHPDEIVEVENVCKLDWLISGILPFKDTVMILSYAKVNEDMSTNRKRKPDPPELKLIDWSGDEIYADVLSMKGYERLGLNDYHLGYFTGNNKSPEKYFIISATDAIVAEQRTLLDRIDWLIERKLYKKCWEMCDNIIDPIRRLTIGINHVELLIDKDKWEDASLFLHTILSDKSIKTSILIEEWDRWSWIFIKSNHIIELSAIIPTQEELEIKQEIYNKIINYCLENNQSMLIKLIYQWPPPIYNSNSLKNQIEDSLNEKELNKRSDNSLRMALADLYTRTNDPLSALYHLLILHHITVISHISKYHLLPQIHSMITQIFTYNLTDDELNNASLDIIRDKTKETVQLFVDGRHQILPEVVINKLSSSPTLDIILFLYLEELNKKDSFIAKGFGDLQVKLYAEFDRDKLIGFFSRNNNYSLNKALEICEKSNYIPELVYLLGKVGQNQKALRLIIEKIGDPQQALDFATSQNDKDLWNDLIHYSLKNPLFIKVLLEKGTGSIDPIRIIKDIPSDMNIPGLKDALIKLFIDKEILKNLNIGVLDIITEEGRHYSQQLRKKQLKGESLSLTDDNKDLSLVYILTPDNEIKTEQELIGRKVPPWIDDDNPNQPFWSVTKKVSHLAYILRNLST